ncbi:unnamed protein product [Rotaria sordida]|uniref:G domain-containing protein n=1 Tax=Rotaria sordida TaxID=392033 RepID=A0A814DEF9_9BILA|nr:unnamed protein product [Rotaria sordida]
MSNEQPLFVTSRKAIDSSGSIGSLYDGYKDLILGKVNMSSKEKRHQAHKSKQCMIINGNNDQKENILKIIGVENELRLSILLNLRDKTGLSAIIDYSNPINEYTRFFYYSYLDREEQLYNNPPKMQSFNESSKLQTIATHIITGIQTGIEVIIVLQLPSDTELITKIDRILHRMRALLLNDDKIFTLTLEEENLLQKNIIHTKTYSNTLDIQNINRLYEICRYINQNQNNTINSPLSYTIRPIKWLYPVYTGQSTTFVSLPEDLINNIEWNVLQLKDDIMKLETSIKQDVPTLLKGYLKEQLSNLQKYGSNVNSKYINEIERFAKLVIDVRSGKIRVPTIDQALSSSDQSFIKTTIRDLTLNLNDLKEKGHFINDLERQQFRYLNVTEHDIDRIDNEKTIERKLVTDDERDCILCSNDALNKTKSGQLLQLRHDAIEELKNNSNLRLIYADFSYCSFELKNMMKLPSNKYTNGQDKSKQRAIIPSRQFQTTNSSSTKVLTNTQNIDPRFTKTQTYLSSETKPQNSLPLTTERQAQVSTPKKVENAVPVLIKAQITSPPFEKTQTYASSQIKPQSFFLSTTEGLTNVSTPTKVDSSVPASSKALITGPFSIKTQTYSSSQTKTQTSILPRVEVHTSTPTSNKLQTSVPLPTEIQTFDLSSKKTYIPATSSSPDTDIINILLLGETGVGKSTFINAFVNYLTFASLQQAESGKPVVLIPVSFLITIGDNFEERMIRFGNVDNSSNEDFDHPGQSVTQCCKSYVFHLNDHDKKKLRIIDTPGFGDTRGIQQDDRNIEHILEYVNNLTHLNAICFLLNPNASRLNVFFRSCLTQLFSLLDQNALNNIIFCFTNSRSTFYTPGDTAPLLKKMLNSLSIGNVPFKKENTFCFDSESFRYLVALQNGISFNNDEKHEYEMSWSTSVTQSNRLIDYIRRNITIYRIDNNLQSMKHAQFEIMHMISPMLETMRNILRNLILYRMNSLKTSIELRPKVNHQSTTRCRVCKPIVRLVGNFPVAYYRPHVVKKDCCNCSCPLNQHIPMYCVLEYEYLKNSWNYNEKEMNDRLHELCNVSAEFAHFLMHVVCSTKVDPFLIGFVEMITEEDAICNSQTSDRFNLQLVNDLRNLKNKYDNRFNEILHNENYRKLSDIYNLINTISKYPMVCEQLAAVKEGQKIMMKQHEHEISRIS